jgi:cholesterol transport system auxiliary component
MKKGIFILLGVLVTGCSLFPEGEPPLPLYVLKSGPITPTQALKEPLAVDDPVSEVSLNTHRIAITPSPYQRDYLADGQWPDRLPTVFEEILIESLSERWGGTYVNRNSAALKTTYVLFSEIQDFSLYPMEGGSSEVRLRVMFKVIDFQNRQAIAARTFSEKVPVSCLSMHTIVEAFNQGLQTLLKKAMPWMESVFLPSAHKKE